MKFIINFLFLFHLTKISIILIVDNSTRPEEPVDNGSSLLYAILEAIQVVLLLLRDQHVIFIENVFVSVDCFSCTASSNKEILLSWHSFKLKKKSEVALIPNGIFENYSFSTNSCSSLYASTTNRLCLFFALPSESQGSTAITTTTKINLMMSETVKNITLQNNYNYTTQVRKKKTMKHKNEEGQKRRSAKKRERRREERRKHETQ